MAGGCGWSRRVAARTRTLRSLVRDTQRALDDVADILHFDPDIPVTVQEIGNQASRSTALVILGTSPVVRARLLHCLLGRQLLPDPPPRGCRWVRIQYGSSTQVHLTLGNSEFELVEELECNKRPWDVLPVEDLIRRDKTDLTTILEVEISNQFLKDGLRIILPPDLDVDPGISSHLTLKKLHSDLYTKRDSILKNFNPVYLYGVDRIGKNVFSDNISESIETSRSEEDFWNTFNLYSMARVGKEGGDGESTGSGDDKREVKRKWSGESSEPAVFSGENCLDLHQIKEINPNAQILFMLFSDSEDMSKPEEPRAEADKKERRINIDALKWIFRHNQESSHQKSPEDDKRLHQEQTKFMNELMDQWELMTSPPQKHYVKTQYVILNDSDLRSTEHKTSPYTAPNSDTMNGKEEKTVKTRTGLLSTIVKFATDCLQSYLLEFCTKLSEVHVKLLQQFILASFDMARELQVVPKKIQYVAKQEQQLYETINEKFSEGDKKQELLQIMQEVLQEMRSEVNNMDWSVDDLPWHRDTSFQVSNSIFYSSSRSSPSFVSLRPPPPDLPPDLPSDSEEALSLDTYNFDDYDIIAQDINDDSYGQGKSQESQESPYNIRVENESEMYSLSSGGWSGTCTSTRNISVKQASLDVQQTVLSKLSQKISLKLVKFVDCLKVTYFGTLQRCLESLESSCRQELGGRPASEAMRQLLSVARQVDLSPCATFPILRSLLESLRRILYKLRLVGGEAEEACCVLSPLWRRRVAATALQQLSPHRLARLISAQILERLSMAHERYQSALTSLESALAGRLHHTEDIKLAIRKKYAPTFARLCLESTSMCDLLMYGTPELGREIGRGQYGVVYSVRGSWGGRSPVAVKSVLPADERHYRELAMEFFYTRSIPAHPRIVRLHGSVVQRSGSGCGAGPCVLLVSERKVRDLHAAVRAGLSFSSRMRIAADIVEGIRYLHSLGLVHRDIKMKNVLLDSADRAALSDLGFCAAEALISGSVVGTPVHMAPELLAGEYDASVDVYAFGILFWYVCAGNIKLPSAFETFQNKEQLWSKVKRGLRPERLPQFSDECWEIMESCWASEPSQRALLGDIQAKLERIMEVASTDVPPPQEYAETAAYETDDSLDMTGIDRHGMV
ncbi:dual serine/threonine and tyrosine protein kinase-like [Anticarsia gemmatalis]|uniref:dual serine/threonine and tyrosine protein kinase-like n=1 Tax=Anticarsia gemmatalis TaxID=129554 RepID=UPI003F77498E